jgi:poly [ADP-ribose] polymerase
MARQAIEDNYTISSNKVTQTMIDEAQAMLNNLINADSIELFNKTLLDLFRTIPRKMSRVKDYLADNILEFENIIEKEQDLLDVMKGQVVQHSITDEEIDNSLPVINQTILDVMGLQFGEITDRERNIIKFNLGSCSDKYYQAWKVINLKTQEKFDKFVKESNIKDIKLLFHGSRSENWWSIINSGLILKPTNAIRTGSMFGAGLYFSNDAGKSLNYTSLSGSYWTHGSSQSGFMSLNMVAYGKPYDVYSFDSKYYNLNYDNLQKMCLNAHCLHAHGGTGMLRRDEIIIYKEEQCTIQYLVELR